MPSTTRRQFLAASSLLAGCLTGGQPDGSFESVDGHWVMDGEDSGHSRRVTTGACWRSARTESGDIPGGVDVDALGQP